MAKVDKRYVRPTIKWPDFETDGENSWTFNRRVWGHGKLLQQEFLKLRMKEWRKQGCVDTPEGLIAAETVVRAEFGKDLYPPLLSPGARKMLGSLSKPEMEKLFEALGGHDAFLKALKKDEELRRTFYLMVLKREGVPAKREKSVVGESRPGFDDLSNEVGLAELLNGKV